MNIKPYTKKDGKTYYYFRAYNGIDDLTGKQKQIKRKGFKSYKDAQLAYLKYIEKGDSKERKDSSRLTYKDVYLEWTKVYETQVRESSYILVTSAIERHVLPVIGHILIQKIDHSIAQRLMDKISGLYDEPRKMKSNIDLVFKYAIRMDYIEKSPMSLVVIQKKNEIKEFENYYDTDELNTFLAALDSAQPMWRMYFYLIAMTGIRRGEALALEWADIDFENKVIRINKTLSKAKTKAVVAPPKTASSYRLISISEDVIEELQRYKTAIKQHKKLVFPNTKNEHITLSQPQKKLDAILAGTDLKRLTVHGLRHTHCCLLFEAGASIAQVQQRLGHSDVTTTLEIYNHVTKKKEKEVAELFAGYLFHNQKQDTKQDTIGHENAVIYEKL